MVPSFWMIIKRSVGSYEPQGAGTKAFHRYILISLPRALVPTLLLAVVSVLLDDVRSHHTCKENETGNAGHVRFETAPTILVGARRGKPRAKRPHKAATAKSEWCVCAENMATFPFFLKKTNRQSPSQSQHLLLYSTSPLFCIP